MFPFPLDIPNHRQLAGRVRSAGCRNGLPPREAATGGPESPGGVRLPAGRGRGRLRPLPPLETWSPRRVAAGLAVAAAMVAGCRAESEIRPGDIRRYTAAREKLAPASALAKLGRPAAPAAAPRVTYTLPDGWSEQSGPAGMRLATLAIGDPAAGQEVTIIPAAGTLRSNVERWQKQLDADASAEAIAETVDRALAEAGSVDVEGRKATVVLLEAAAPAGADAESGATEAILGGILPLEGGKAVFVKFRGAVEVARRERSNFLKFIASLRLP